MRPGVVFELSQRQRQEILRFVAERSPNGEPFRLDEKTPERIAGVDLGRALLHLDVDGLCGTEDPDIVWSTPSGLKAVNRLPDEAL